MNKMGKITSTKNAELLDICELSAQTSYELLEEFEMGSPEFKIYIAGISYGIWIASCDIVAVKLKSIQDIIMYFVKSNMN